MNKIKQRQFHKVYGFWVVLFNHSLQKMDANGKVGKLSEEEFSNWFHFKPKHWTTKVKTFFQLWLDRIEARYDEFRSYSYKMIADAKSRASNYRTFMVIEDWNGNYHVATWSGIKKLKNKGLVNKQAKRHDFLNEAIYVTPSKKQVERKKELKKLERKRERTYRRMSKKEKMQYLGYEIKKFEEERKTESEREKVAREQIAEETNRYL